eukprot:s3228_g12.t2
MDRAAQPGDWSARTCLFTRQALTLSVSGGTPVNSSADDGSAVTTTTMTSTSTATSLPCITAERFWLGSDSTGTVTVNGPRNEGTLVERAGTPFRLILQGTSLSSRDRVRITDGSTDCFDLAASKPMHPAVATDFPYTDPSGQRFSGSASQEIWENIGVTVPGTYQVCWCSAGGTVSNSCSDDQEFTTNVATLEVGGPTAGVIQSFACITGVACTLAMTGSGLNNNDRIIIIADHLECGFAPQSSAVVSGGDFASPRTSGSDMLSRFGGIIMGRHGDFKVCWCGSYDEIRCPTCCTQMDQYTVYAGNVSSGGPNQGQIDRPPIGVPFAYTITGWGMSSNDRIRIVDQTVRCGRAGAETHSLGIEASTVPNGPPTYTEGSDPANRTSASWTDIVAREMRSYRVCWCAHFFMGCTDGAHFALDIGIINPRGASNSTYINAIPGRPFSLTVTAATGSYLTADDRIRIVRAEVSDGRCGGFGTAEHSPAVAALACWPTCIDSPVWGAPEMGPDNESQIWDPVLIMESGTYNICWCNSGQGGCDSDEDFSFRAGMIMANGVNIGQHWHCAAYFPCTVEIQMSDGLASGDYLQLVAAAPGARCGVDSRAAATSFTRGTRISGYEGRDTSGQDVVLFEFGSPQAPGIYLACYCQGSICRTSSVTDLDFFQQAGQVTVMGLQGRDDYHKCYLRGACRLNIRGAGLDAQDAVMLLDPMDNCGQTGSPVSFSLDGPRFFTAGGDRLFIGNLTSTSNEGLESWTFDLGTPIRTGRHRLCYCSRGRASSGMCENRADFDQAAGELFVRGSEFNSELRCEQGESCRITARGAQFDALDRMVLLKDGIGHSCGMVNSGQYPSWIAAMTPENIQPDAIIPDLWAATWIISSVREPGTYRICYCAYIIGGTACVEPGQSTPYERYRHELGTVRVTGSILAVRQVGVTPGYWQPKLPAAKYAVSVEVDVLNTFMKYTCVATTRPAPDNFIPRKSDLENCTKDVEELNDRQRFFPRCWGIGTTVETVIDMGPNLVHVPTHIPDITLESSTEMHVWCYGRDLCSNDRCVMPADNIGLAVPITGGLVSYSTNWAATVSTPFALRVPLASDFDIGDPWPRMKIVTHESACDSTQLHRSVMGITCLESGVGMCEPAPISTLSSGSWGSGRELIWTGIAVTRADKFTVCYCDRHYASTCVGWISIGTLQVSGPQNAGNMRFVVNPGVPGTVTINGIGLATEDRIRIIPQNVGCMVVSMPTTTTPSTRRLQAGIDFRSGSALSANGSHEEWEVLISVEGTYNVCWCGGTESSCSEADDYTVYLGTLSVATKRDCEAFCNLTAAQNHLVDILLRPGVRGKKASLMARLENLQKKVTGCIDVALCPGAFGKELVRRHVQISSSAEIELTQHLRTLAGTGPAARSIGGKPSKCTESLESSYQCQGTPGYDQSCIFHCAYLAPGDDKQWMVTLLLLEDGQTQDPAISDWDMPAIRVDNPVSVRVKRFSSATELESHARNMTLNYRPGLSVLFRALWQDRWAHALFDGLYPAFVSLARFGLENHVFTPVAIMSNYTAGLDCKKPESQALGLSGAGIYTGSACQMEEAFRLFGTRGGRGRAKRREQELLRLSDLWELLLNAKAALLFDHLISGSAHMGEYASYVSLPGTKDSSLAEEPSAYGRDILGEFSDRLYLAHGLEPASSKTSSRPGPAKEKFKVIITANKRMTPEEVASMKELAQQGVASHKNFSMEVSFVDWSLVQPFRKQLELLQNTDIMVTGIGTAMFYSTFLPFGSVCINTGWKDSSLMPTYGEEVLGMSNHRSKFLYMPLEKLRDGMGKADIEHQIQLAASLITEGFSLPLRSSEENLSIFGRIIHDLGQQSDTSRKGLQGREQLDGGFLCHQRPTGQTSLSETWPHATYQQLSPGLMRP